MAVKKVTKEIKIPAIPVETVTVSIAGDSPLILNRMCRRDKEDMLNKQANRPKNTEARNEWDDAATKLHWDIPIGIVTTEEEFESLFEKGNPCMSAFGFQQSLSQAVSRYGFDGKGTEFRANVQIFADEGLIPIKYESRELIEDLIPTNTMSHVPVRSVQNVFHGWSADITIRYIDNGKFSLEQILQIIGYAGFGIGMGAARTGGNGRYHITGAHS